MSQQPKPETVARALHISIGLLTRRLRQTTAPGGLTLPETSALARLDRGGATTASAWPSSSRSALSRWGRLSAPSRRRGLIQRENDPDDGRRIVLSITDEPGTGARRATVG